MEKELAAVERINIRLLGDQSEPNVIESEHPSVVAGVVHVHQGVSGQDVGVSRDVRGPEVECVLGQVHEPFAPLVNCCAGGGTWET